MQEVVRPSSLTFQGELDILLRQMEPALRAAFWDAMQDWRSNIDFAELIAALEQGDIERAISALRIDPAVFNQYVMAQTAIFAGSGSLTSRYIPGEDGILFRFDMTNPRAEAYIRDYSATRITGYTQEQIDTARRVMVDGYSRGQGPQNIAVEIAGRVDRISGRRRGGIVGLSDPQAAYVQSVRQALESGDYRSLFVRDQKTGELKPRYSLMDGRDLRMLKSRALSGKPLTTEQIEQITGRYADRLLARRAEDIARTETAQGVMAARQESYRQALEKAGLPMDAVTKTWVHAGANDKHARVQHVVMNGVAVVGLDGSFTMPDGTQMKHSHDPEGGAKHNVNCRCDTTYRIDFKRARAG